MDIESTYIDTPTATGVYSTTASHTSKKRIRVPKKLKEKLTTYASTTATSQGYTYATQTEPYSYTTTAPYSTTNASQTNYSTSTGQSYGYSDYSSTGSYSRGTSASGSYAPGTSYTQTSRTGTTYTQPTYTTNGASYTTDDATYTTNGASYTTNGASYTTNGASYTTNGASYTTNGVSYTTNGASYTTRPTSVADSYTTGNESYTTRPAGESYVTGAYSYTTRPGSESYTTGADSYTTRPGTTGMSYSKAPQSAAYSDSEQSYSSATSYSVFVPKPSTTTAITTTDVYDTMGAVQTATTDDSLTRRIHLKVKVKDVNKNDEKAKKRAAAKFLLHRNGVVAPTDVKDESIDAVSLDPVTAGELASLDMSSSLEVPYKETVRPFNDVKKVNAFDDDEDSTLTMINPEPKKNGLKLYNSRFLGHHADSDSDSETSTTLDSTTVESNIDSTADDTIPSVINKDEYEAKYKNDVAERAIAVDIPNDDFAIQEAARMKKEERMRRMAEYRLAVEEAIKNGEDPPPTLVETATSELDTAEAEMRMEQEMNEVELELKKAEENMIPLSEMLPKDKTIVTLPTKHGLFDSSDDEIYEIRDEARPYVYEAEGNKKEDIGHIANQMGLFGSIKPMSISDIQTYELDSEEYSVLKKAEEERRKAEMEKKIRDMKRQRKIQTRDLSTSEAVTTTTTASTQQSADNSSVQSELIQIDEKYMPNVQGGAYPENTKRGPALKLPEVNLNAEKKVRQRPKRGSQAPTTTTTTTGDFQGTTVTQETYSQEVHEYFTNTDSNSNTGTHDAGLVTATTTESGYMQSSGKPVRTRPSRGNHSVSMTSETQLVTANPTSADFVEASSNDNAAQLYVEVPGTTTTGEDVSQTDGMTTVSALVTANQSSADFVEAGRNSKNAQLYVEVPATTTTTTQDLTTVVSEYVTATDASASGPLYVEASSPGTTHSYSYSSDEEDSSTSSSEEEEDYSDN